MKYCILIMDGSAGLPIPERGGKTSLELARTPNLDALAVSGRVGQAHNVPPGMDPDSAVACMSIFGYDPAYITPAGRRLKPRAWVSILRRETSSSVAIR